MAVVSFNICDVDDEDGVAETDGTKMAALHLVTVTELCASSISMQIICGIFVTNVEEETNNNVRIDGEII